jgi:hypothetical protein
MGRRRPAVIEQVGSPDDSGSGLGFLYMLSSTGWFYSEQVDTTGYSAGAWGWR